MQFGNQEKIITGNKEFFMTFTTVELANRMGNEQLTTWADSTLQNQAQFLHNFQNYFAGLQEWITSNGGANPFGWQHITGLVYPNSQTQVVLTTPVQIAIFNDAFDDVRTHLNTPGFRLFQAAQNIQRLIGVLPTMTPPRNQPRH
jgi:hypothetical protein